MWGRVESFLLSTFTKLESLPFLIKNTPSSFSFKYIRKKEVVLESVSVLPKFYFSPTHIFLFFSIRLFVPCCKLVS